MIDCCLQYLQSGVRACLPSSSRSKFIFKTKMPLRHWAHLRVFMWTNHFLSPICDRCRKWSGSKVEITNFIVLNTIYNWLNTKNALADPRRTTHPFMSVSNSDHRLPFQVHTWSRQTKDCGFVCQTAHKYMWACFKHTQLQMTTLKKGGGSKTRLCRQIICTRHVREVRDTRCLRVNRGWQLNVWDWREVEETRVRT